VIPVTEIARYLEQIATQVMPSRPVHGSLADMRLRLGRLPAGHPSSPLSDDGTPKPLPQRLRHLELPVAGDEYEGEVLAAEPPPTPVPTGRGTDPPSETEPARGEQPPSEPLPDNRADDPMTSWDSQDPDPEPGSAEDQPVDPMAGQRAADLLPRPHPDWDGALSPEQEGAADRTLARFRLAEGRTVFGSYGESGLTPAIRRIAAQLPYGGLAPGSEPNTLKPPARFKAKLARLVARNPGEPPEELATEVYDAVRYAFIFEAEHYTEGTWRVHRQLKARGFELEGRRNSWQRPECKGIRTRWRDPAHGLPFEVQFHTPASWQVLRRSHDDYMVITDPSTPHAQRARLRMRQAAASAFADRPPGCDELADFSQRAVD
jgi:hypothetical protein